MEGPGVAASVGGAAEAEQRHAIAVAVATATVTTAQAAVEVARLSRPAPAHVNSIEICAAIVIQTAFRGYLVSGFASCFS